MTKKISNLRLKRIAQAVGGTFLIGGAATVGAFAAPIVGAEIAGLVVVGIVSGGAGISLCFSGNKKGRELTENEKNLVEAIFGDEINVSKVRKHFSKTEMKTRAALTYANGKDVEFFGERFQLNDHAKAKDSLAFGNFMHEMTHIWQFQNKRNKKRGAHLSGETYKYILRKDFNFSSYGCEQQASIIEDYARRFLHGSHAVPYRAQNKNTQERDVLLAQVVETRFPQAKVLRISCLNR